MVEHYLPYVPRIIQNSGSIVSPAKQSYGSVTDGQTDRQTDRRTDRRTDRQTGGQTTDKVIPMCRYASQATQKSY